MGQHFVPVGKAHLEHGSCQYGADGAFHFNFTFGVFFLGFRFVEILPAFGVASSASLRTLPVGVTSGAASTPCSGISRSCGLSGRPCHSCAIAGRPGLSGTVAGAGWSGTGTGILTAAGTAAGSWIRADRTLLVRLKERACTNFAQANDRPYFCKGKS